MSHLASTSLCNGQISRFHSPFLSHPRTCATKTPFPIKVFRIRASSNELDTKTEQGSKEDLQEPDKDQVFDEGINISGGPTSASPALDKDLKKVVQKTAATFAPRASTATKNPAVPAIPSLRARDCSKNEKEALNYLFLLIPLLNVIIPFFWKSFAVVWSADTVAFIGMYAWKLGWFSQRD